MTAAASLLALLAVGLAARLVDRPEPAMTAQPRHLLCAACMREPPRPRLPPMPWVRTSLEAPASPPRKTAVDV